MDVIFPTDIQIAGFNNISSSFYTQPSLTTINVHEELMSQLAFETLVSNFNHKSILRIKQIVPTELKIRKSTNLVYEPE